MKAVKSLKNIIKNLLINCLNLAFVFCELFKKLNYNCIMKNQNWLPVKDYAVKYSVSVQNVYQQIKRGKLKGKKLGNYQLVLDN